MHAHHEHFQVQYIFHVWDLETHTVLIMALLVHRWHGREDALRLENVGSDDPADAIRRRHCRAGETGVDPRVGGSAAGEHHEELAVDHAPPSTDADTSVPLERDFGTRAERLGKEEPSKRPGRGSWMHVETGEGVEHTGPEEREGNDGVGRYREAEDVDGGHGQNVEVVLHTMSAVCGTGPPR